MDQTTIEEIGAIEAEVVYTIDTGEKMVNEITGPGAAPRYQIGGQREVHTVRIENARPINDRLSIDAEGFRLVRHDTKVRDFWDEDEVRRVYYPEMEQLIMAETGASRVIIFDHTLRSGDPARQSRQPVTAVHNDYTERSGPSRVRDLLPKDEAEALFAHPFAIIQVWRPTGLPAERNPLAICASQSIDEKDLIPVERRAPERIGETYSIAYNPKHRWYYFPRMARDEAIVFKVYDSRKDGRSRWSAHTSIDDPTTRPDAPPRESIEIRTIASFAP